MSQFTEETFEAVLKTAGEASALDLREAAAVELFSMIGVLTIGQATSKSGTKKKLLLPDAKEILRSLHRMDFFSHAEKAFSLHPPDVPYPETASDNSGAGLLLGITPIEKLEDIDLVTGRINKEARQVLSSSLHYDDKTIKAFLAAFSEVCRNVVEHSEGSGYAGIQMDHNKSIGKKVLKVTVMDAGAGFRKTLMDRFLVRNDLHAIEMALLQGVSRSTEKGRGDGLTAVRNFVKKMNGRMSVRSGTAKLSIVPKWSRAKEKELNLVPFPGAQISIVLPEA